MTFPQGANLYGIGIGTRPENVEVPFVSNVAPSASDYNFPIGKHWIVTGVGEYVLVALSNVGGTTTATWVLAGTIGGALNTLTGGSGGPLTPTANNINILGTASQITSTGSGSTITMSIPSAFIAPGSIASTTTIAAGSSVTAGTTVTATLGNITATNGNLNLASAGNKILIHATTAASDSVGTSAALDGASPSQLVVSTTAVTSASKIFLSYATAGGTQGSLSVGTIVNGTSFQIKSSANGDTSTVNYLIIN